MRTPKEYLKTLQEHQLTLIPNSFTDEWLEPYFEAAVDYDMEYLGIKFSNLALISDDVIIINALVRNAVRMNAYKWEKLYKTTLLEYNPIWNVDGTETETHDIGQRETTNNYGENKSSGKSSQVPDDMTTEKEVASSESTINAREDKSTEASTKDVITRVRSGNIGVTKTQDMIKDERGVAVFNYLDIVLTDVVNAITYPYFVED